MCDVDGLLTNSRKDGNLDGHKKYYAKEHEPMKDLGEIVKKIKPSVSADLSRQFIIAITFCFDRF